MHAFDFRLTQLLDRVSDLTPARRQRLARTLRQDDVELGVRATEPSLDAALKAALRVAAHEVLDAFCVHLEGALARCRNDRVRALAMAIVAIVLAEQGCVLFAEPGDAAPKRGTGMEFPAAQRVVIAVSPNAEVDLEVSCRANDGEPSTDGALHIVVARDAYSGEGSVLAIAAEAIDADPFCEAKRVLERVRAGERA
jgi:hypothetical protein